MRVRFYKLVVRTLKDRDWKFGFWGRKSELEFEVGTSESNVRAYDLWFGMSLRAMD